MVQSNNAVMERAARNTSTFIAACKSKSTSILDGEPSNHRVGLAFISTRIHAPIRRRRISAVDDRIRRAVHRLDGDRLVVRVDRRVRAVGHDDRHSGHRLVDRVLDRLERLRCAVALVRVVARRIYIPLVRPLGVEVHRRVHLVGHVQHRLSVRVGDRRSVRRGHPPDEGMSRAGEAVRRERRVLSVDAGELRRGAAAAVRVELHGVGVHLPHGEEGDRAVGRRREVADGLSVRVGRARRAARRGPPLERVARAREGVRRQRLGRAVGERLVRHRARAAVLVELHGIRVRRPLGRHRLRAEAAGGDAGGVPAVEHIACHVRQRGEGDGAVDVVLRGVRVRRPLRVRVGDGVVPRMLERGRVVGRPRRVGQRPVVRLLRVWRPGVGALARKPRHRRAVDLERPRARPTPGRIVGDGLRCLRDARPRARIERNRRSRLRRRHGFNGANWITIGASRV